MADYPRRSNFMNEHLAPPNVSIIKEGQALAHSNLAEAYQKTGHYKEAFALAGCSCYCQESC